VTNILLITGPTAVGKTDAAVRIAERLDGEVISADSRQMYRYFDIGTAKPDGETLRRVKHHLVDIRDPGRDYSAGEFVRDAVQIARSLEAVGKVPIVCGGATLYLHALTRGLFREGGDKSEMLKARKELIEEAQSRGIASLYERLMLIDTATAKKLRASDTQRIIRALEVHHATGLPLSEWHRTGVEKPPVRCMSFCLFVSREELAKRIEQRTRKMFEQGLVTEVRNLLGRGYDEESGPFTSVGYREVVAFIRGSIPLKEAERLIIRNTKLYAKRQMTWFRGMRELTWIPNNEDAVDYVCEAWEKRHRRKAH
jgi:tRNA dimethylallyltransferase